MSHYDLANLALQMTAPKNELLYDDLGDPSVMVRIPKFKVADVVTGGSDATHPAFLVNGKEVDGIYISKYQNVLNNGRAYSLPMQDPAVYINFDQAWEACKAKGKGWHLMTNAEWAAVALWCKKNGFLPSGNNAFGKNHSETNLPQKAIPSYIYEENGETRVGRTATGSGPLSWYHDNTAAGIADLNGNVWEWVAGVRLLNGEIHILENNNAADWNCAVGADSTHWRAVLQDGRLVAPGTANALKWDYRNNRITLISGATEEKQDINRGTAYAQLATGSDVQRIPEILKSLSLHPDEVQTINDIIWANITGERLPLRGGDWDGGSMAGVFAFNLNLPHPRSSVRDDVGFRAAFCDL